MGLTSSTASRGGQSPCGVVRSARLQWVWALKIQGNHYIWTLFFFFLIRHIKFLHVYSTWPKINELTYFYKFVNPTRNVIKQRGLQKSIAPAQAVQSDLKAWVILYRSNSAQHAGADLHVNNPPQGLETMTGCCSFCSPEEPLASFLSRCCHTILPFLPPFQRSSGFCTSSADDIQTCPLPAPGCPM